MDASKYSARLSWRVEDGAVDVKDDATLPGSINSKDWGRAPIKEAIDLHGAGSGRWRYIDDTFTAIHLCNFDWIANDAFMAPPAAPTDGLLTAVFIRGNSTSRFDLIKMFMAAETGKHYTTREGRASLCSPANSSLSPKVDISQSMAKYSSRGRPELGLSRERQGCSSTTSERDCTCAFGINTCLLPIFYFNVYLVYFKVCCFIEHV